MLRQLRTVVIGLGCLGLGGGVRPALAAPLPAPAPPSAPASGVEAGPAGAAPAPFLGVVVPARSAELSSKFESKLERLSVKVGDVVRQGQELASLEAGPLQQQLAGAKAALQGARADERAAAVALAEARDRKARYFTPRSLRLGIYSQEELTTVRAQEQTAAAKLEAARAQVTERQARLDELQQSLAGATLTAPFDGVVAACPVSPGARVAAGQPILRLLGNGGWRIRFAVPEDAVAQLREGAPLRISVPERSLTLDGRIESLSPEVDAAARMVFALATFAAPPPAEVTAGLVVRVQTRAGDGGGGSATPGPAWSGP